MQDYSALSDTELVALALQDKEHFLPLMRRYEERLLRYIRRISNASLQDAEDILQEIFLKTYLNLNGFDHKLKFSSWIYRIAHNETMSHFRKVKARPQAAEMEDDAFLNLASDLDIKKTAETNELAANMHRVLENMDEKYREVLILKYLEELDYNEISDVLRKPLGTIGTLLRRAKNKFKDEARKLKIEF